MSSGTGLCFKQYIMSPLFDMLLLLLAPHTRGSHNTTLHHPRILRGKQMTIRSEPVRKSSKISTGTDESRTKTSSRHNAHDLSPLHLLRDSPRPPQLPTKSCRLRYQNYLRTLFSRRLGITCPSNDPCESLYTTFHTSQDFYRVGSTSWQSYVRAQAHSDLHLLRTRLRKQLR